MIIVRRLIQYLRQLVHIFNLGWREAMDERAAGGAVGAHVRGVVLVAQLQVRAGVRRSQKGGAGLYGQ